MRGERFTAWLEHDERAALGELARLHDRSANWIVRMALRALLFDDPIPTQLQSTPDREKAPQ